MPESLIGVVLDSRYRLDRELGRGGMATVYAARDLRHDREVALKVLHQDLLAAGGGERFAREVRTTARLTHPHIVGLLDSGSGSGAAGEPLAWYAMPLVDGESLRARLDRDGPLPVEDAVRLAREIAEAMEFAHQRGVIHRDLKPENVLLSGGHAVVADFGIALALGAAGTRLTSTGVSVGTPAYMSPEQVTGDRALDARADVYALGCLLYEMLAGEPPYTGPTPQAVVAKHLGQAIPSLRTVRAAVPQGIDRCVTRALAKQPADRFPSAAAFAAALTTSAAERPRTARLALAALMVVVMVAAGVALTRDRPSRSPSPDRSEVVLAVLPFENLSADSGDAYVAKGMSEEVTAALGRLRGMRVLTPSSAASFSGPGGRDRARDEGVTYLIEGSVRKQGDRSRISVRLSDVAGTEVWHQSFERTGADLLGVETEVAHAVAAGLRGELPTGAESGLRPPPTASLEAYDLFLRSLGVDGVARSQPRERAQLLGRAVAIDPSFSQAWAALSQALLATAIVGGARLEDVVDSARAAARRAIALDSTQAEGWAALGQVLFRYDWDWAAAEAAHRRAIALSPNNALAHGAYARVLRSLGRFDEAHAEYGLVAQLDPVLRRSDASRGRAYYYAREYDKALQIYRGTADGSPTFVFEALCQLRRFPEARVALAAAHDSTELTGLPHWGYYYAMSGERARALAIAAQLEAAAETRYVQPYLMALLYTALGDRDAAFRWLERGYREKSDRMVDLLVEPRFDPIRGDPRYDDLLRRLGFTKRP